MKELSFFTGGGGGVWASNLLGHKMVGYVEFEDYPLKADGSYGPKTKSNFGASAASSRTSYWEGERWRKNRK